MLHGNDILQEDGLYVISIYGTTTVWTQEGPDIYMRKYKPGDLTQVFQCTLSANKHIGFISMSSGKRAGRNKQENLRCNTSVSSEDTWESFELRQLSGGGYQILMPKESDAVWPLTGYTRLCPLATVMNDAPLYPEGKTLEMRRDSKLVFGVTRAPNSNSLDCKVEKWLMKGY